MLNKPELENLLTSFFKPLPEEIRQSLRWSHCISFDSGALAERINFVLNETRGTASNGGCAFDAVNGSEVKSAFFAQPSVCNHCGSKVNFYAEQCHVCRSTDLKQKSDTRWGIDAEAHFRYLDQIPYYLLVAIKPLNKDLDNLQFNVEIFRISADDPIFSRILRHQCDHGLKKHKNFMPYGRDFYMSSPTKVLSVNVTIGEDVTYDYECDISEWITQIDTALFTKAERALLGDVPVVDIDVAYQVVGLGHSTHGKKRGETNRKIK